MNFMKLLITELQNQNPLEPMDNKEMASQLAQLSQLELTEGMNTNLGTLNKTVSGMNTSFEGALVMAKLDHAKSMLGKTVSFYDTASGIELLGSVKQLTFGKDGNPVLTIQSGDHAYKATLNSITGIQA